MPSHLLIDLSTYSMSSVSAVLLLCMSVQGPGPRQGISKRADPNPVKQPVELKRTHKMLGKEIAYGSSLKGVQFSREAP